MIGSSSQCEAVSALRSASSSTSKTAGWLALAVLPPLQLTVISGVGNLSRPLIGLGAVSLLRFRPLATIGCLSSGVTNSYPDLASTGPLCGGGLPFFSHFGTHKFFLQRLLHLRRSRGLLLLVALPDYPRLVCFLRFRVIYRRLRGLQSTAWFRRSCDCGCAWGPLLSRGHGVFRRF